MKRIYVLLAAAMLLASPAASAQALLNKLKEKAENAVNSAVNSTISDKIGEKVGDVIGKKTGIDVNAAQNSSVNGMPVPDSRETLQPKRSSSFGWDGKITPSKAEFPIPLMGEFPAVPSASQLANPTEEAQIAYYQAIKAVTLRAEELNEDTTCEDSFTEKWRQETMKSLQDAYGLTDAEMAAIQNPNTSQAELERIAQKMSAHILGGINPEEIMNAAPSAPMSQEDIENKALAASCAIYDKYDAQLRKYFGCTAEEYKTVARESMKSGDDKASKELQKKSEAYMKTLDSATQKEAKDFQSKIQKELMQATFADIPGANAAMQIATNMGKIENKMSPLLEKYKKVQKYTEDIAKAWPQATWSDADAKFSESERKKIESIKSSIYSTNNPDEYNPLYLQALEIIKTYRERAAKVWAADVQKRFNKVKDGMGDIIKIQRQAIADEIIPECALWRAPLNLVIEAGDILAEAYSSFPSNYPHMYLEEVVREVKLNANEYQWWPEFYIAPTLDEIFAGNNIFKEVEGKVFKFNKGKWEPVPDDYGKNVKAKEKKIADATFKSSDSKREVIFNSNGGFLQLPEGDIVYPLAWAKTDNEIVWAENQTVENADGTVALRVVKCTYKL